jgi:hypothetical protein
VNLKRLKTPRIGETYEILLSTYDNDHSPNAAPMGIRFLSYERIHIRLFKGSRTLQNMLARRCAAANLTNDDILFYRLTFKGPDLNSNLFTKARLVNAPILKSADGHIEMELVKTTQHKDVVLAELRIKRSNLRHVVAPFYSRAAHALVESTIHATRIHEFLVHKQKRKAAKLIRIINHYKEIIGRVSPDSDHERAIKDLQTRINRWKRSKSIC